MAYQDRHRAENMRLDDTARQLVGATVVQPLDLDDPPMPCGHRGCGQDAVIIARMNVGTAGEYGMTACDVHTETMLSATGTEPTR
jgi:hypothetical protein